MAAVVPQVADLPQGALKVGGLRVGDTSADFAPLSAAQVLRQLERTPMVPDCLFEFVGAVGVSSMVMSMLRVAEWVPHDEVAFSVGSPLSVKVST